jgi:hypothetical protein
VLVAPGLRAVRPAGDVADRHDVGQVGHHAGVGAHAVVDGQAGPVEPAGVRDDPDAHDHDVGRDGGPVAELHAHDAAGAVARWHRREPGHARGRPQLGPVDGVQVDAAAGDPRAEHGGQGQRQPVEHGDLQAHRAAGGRDLGADESPAHDHDARRAVAQLPPQRDRVVERPQGVHALDALGARQPPRPAAGGDDDPVRRDLGAVREHDAASGGVQPRRGGAEAQLEGELRLVVVVHQPDRVLVDAPGEERLRQRRAVVGPVRLVADQDQAPVEAGPAQRLGGADPGDGPADDGDGLHAVSS